MPKKILINKEKNDLSTKGKAKPFLKWAGGKRALLPELKKRIPKTYNTYYEPFVGGGALFFSELPKSAVLSDKNKELINCYKQIKMAPYDIIEVLQNMKYNKKTYYKIRKQNPTDPVEKAARFIYLNRCCWNGLWRVNRKGEFNVPFGRYEHKNSIIDDDTILKASIALQDAKIINVDFATACKDTEDGDFVYFDPPYTVYHGNNGFLAYNEKIFSWENQIELSLLVKKLVDKNVNVLISNAHHKDIIDLYSQYTIIPVSRTSTISGKIESRGKVSELLITTYRRPGET